MLAVSELAKTYRRAGNVVRALRDVTLEVPAGQFVLVCGPSGCGKTTLLLAAGALLAPDSGSVRIAGQNPYDLGAEQRAVFRADHIGFVFQQFCLVPYLSVRQNVQCASLAADRNDLSARADELIEQFKLTPRRDHLPSELSTGEKQRTALARALLNGPKVLLADEPTGNLDGDNGGIVVASLRSFADEGGGVLMVTHDRRWQDQADRVIHLEDGRVSGS